MRMTAIEMLGFRTVGLVAHLGRIAAFIGSIGLHTVRPPWRMRRLVGEVFDVGVLSLAIVCLSGATVGAVLGLQGYTTLARFGAENSLGAVVGLSLVRELGPVLTALLVTGRAGSAMAAEIASMVTTEQLDGLRMMSIDPVDFIITPKALAMIFVMPMLNEAMTTVLVVAADTPADVGSLRQPRHVDTSPMIMPNTAAFTKLPTTSFSKSTEFSMLDMYVPPSIPIRLTPTK